MQAQRSIVEVQLNCIFLSDIHADLIFNMLLFVW